MRATILIIGLLTSANRRHRNRHGSRGPRIKTDRFPASAPFCCVGLALALPSYLFLLEYALSRSLSSLGLSLPARALSLGVSRSSRLPLAVPLCLSRTSRRHSWHQGISRNVPPVWFADPTSENAFFVLGYTPTPDIFLHSYRHWSIFCSHQQEPIFLVRRN